MVLSTTIKIFLGYLRTLPYEVSPRLMKEQKLTAFVAFNSMHGLFGPYWFEEDGKTVTVTGERYRAVITTFTNDLRAVLAARQF